MIIEGSSLTVADNSGAKSVECIRVLGSASYASVGDFIVVTVKSAVPRSKVVAGKVLRAVVVRSRKSFCGESGCFRVSFQDNAVVMLNEQNEMIGSRVFGPVSSLLRDRAKSAAGLSRIVSLAGEVV